MCIVCHQVGQAMSITAHQVKSLCCSIGLPWNAPVAFPYIIPLIHKIRLTSWSMKKKKEKKRRRILFGFW